MLNSRLEIRQGAFWFTAVGHIFLQGPPPQPPRMRPSHPHPGQSSSSSIGSLTTSSVVVHGRTTSFIGPPQPSLFSHINRSQSDNQPGPSTRPLMAGRDSGVVTHTFTPLVFPNYTGSSFSAASMSESVASRQVTLPQLPQASHEATEATAEDIYEDITDDPEPGTSLRLARACMCITVSECLGPTQQHQQLHQHQPSSPPPNPHMSIMLLPLAFCRFTGHAGL